MESTKKRHTILGKALAVLVAVAMTSSMTSITAFAQEPEDVASEPVAMSTQANETETVEVTVTVEHNDGTQTAIEETAAPAQPAQEAVETETVETTEPNGGDEVVDPETDGISVMSIENDEADDEAIETPVADSSYTLSANAEVSEAIIEKLLGVSATAQATNDSGVIKAAFETFKELLKATALLDDALNAAAEGDTIRVTATIADTTVALSTIKTEYENYKGLYDVDFIFNNVTVANDGDPDNSFKPGKNNNDDGYFELVSLGHVTVTFDGCDLQQNVQSGSKGSQGVRNIDLTFRNCNFNGNKVLNIEEQIIQRDTKANPTTIGADGRDIWKSYQGDNIGNLIFENCYNMRSINANGQYAYWTDKQHILGAGIDADGNASVLRVTGCSFIDERNNVPEGMDIGDMLLYAAAFGSYEFSNNTFADGRPLVFVAFKDVSFPGAIQGDSFYQTNETVISRFPSDNDAKMNKPEYWVVGVTDEDGNEKIALVTDLEWAASSVDKPVHVYGALSPMPETPEEPDVPETPEEPETPEVPDNLGDKPGNNTGDNPGTDPTEPGDEPTEPTTPVVPTVPPTNPTVPTNPTNPVGGGNTPVVPTTPVTTITPTTPTVFAPLPVVTTIPDNATPLAADGDNTVDATVGNVDDYNTIEDNDTPLGAFDEDGHGFWCWVHWWIMLGMLVSAIYIVGVIVRRRHFSSKLDDQEEDILYGDEQSAAGSTVPADAR